jgi:hypothetical protein
VTPRCDLYYNFVRVHKSLRTTPALAAGITKRLWEIGDVIDVLEAWEFKVAARNNDVTVYFNGEKATEFRAQAPKTGGYFGAYGGSGDSQSYEWRFLDIVVNE